MHDSIANVCYSKSCVDLVKLEDALNTNAVPRLDVALKHTIEPAHGEEVVRAVVIDDEVVQIPPFVCIS